MKSITDIVTELHALEALRHRYRGKTVQRASECILVLRWVLGMSALKASERLERCHVGRAPAAERP